MLDGGSRMIDMLDMIDFQELLLKSWPARCFMVKLVKFLHKMCGARIHKLLYHPN